MKNLDRAKNTLFFRELDTLLKASLPRIQQAIEPELVHYLSENNFQTPLPLIYHTCYTAWGSNTQWRLELDFDDYQWSYETIKPHVLAAYITIEAGGDWINFKFQLGNTFCNLIEYQKPVKIDYMLLEDHAFVALRITEVNVFLTDLPTAFMQEVKKIPLDDLEFITDDEA